MCPSCGSEMKVIAFITEHDVVAKMKVIALIAEHDVADAILRHLAKAEARSPRGPPGGATLPTTS
ncbi:MAG: hypothetical protein P8127_13920 [Acidobacteriota bacterium]